jgi:tetratricopeptide (TPR) repeat protein
MRYFKQMHKRKLLLIFSPILGLIVIISILYVLYKFSDNDNPLRELISKPITRLKGQQKEKFSSVGTAQERIFKLYDKLLKEHHGAYMGPSAGSIFFEVKGMDVLSAAKFLYSVGVYNYAFEYADAAWAENPDSFEVLLLRTQLNPSFKGQEAGYRRLLEMIPDSAEALVGLGSIIEDKSRLIATSYYIKAIEVDPSYIKHIWHWDSIIVI